MATCPICHGTKKARIMEDGPLLDCVICDDNGQYDGIVDPTEEELRQAATGQFQPEPTPAATRAAPTGEEILQARDKEPPLPTTGAALSRQPLHSFAVVNSYGNVVFSSDDATEVDARASSAIEPCFIYKRIAKVLPRTGADIVPEA